MQEGGRVLSDVGTISKGNARRAGEGGAAYEVGEQLIWAYLTNIHRDHYQVPPAFYWKKYPQIFLFQILARR